MKKNFQKTSISAFEAITNRATTRLVPTLFIAIFFHFCPALCTLGKEYSHLHNKIIHRTILITLEVVFTSIIFFSFAGFCSISNRYALKWLKINLKYSTVLKRYFICIPISIFVTYVFVMGKEIVPYFRAAPINLAFTFFPSEPRYYFATI